MSGLYHYLFFQLPFRKKVGMLFLTLIPILVPSVLESDFFKIWNSLSSIFIDRIFANEFIAGLINSLSTSYFVFTLIFMVS